MTDVRDMIRLGAAQPAPVGVLDAVMGEDWAQIKLGNPRAALQAEYILNRMRERSRPNTSAGNFGAIRGAPQAVVKLIGKGGAGDRRGLKAQMTYLSRNGDVALNRSERFFGTEIEDGDIDGLAASWGMPKTGTAVRTSHFIVSFPEGTDPAAAERAGRAWAVEMFESGRFGDTWDYYTAFHTDTRYPHIHVVASRRGLDHGTWLKVSGRSEIDFDVLREIQAEVASTEGIKLDATPRLSRGVHARPAPDAEIRRARAEGREPIAPEHSLGSAAGSAAAILNEARRIRASAALIEDELPDGAALLNHAAGILEQGRALTHELLSEHRLAEEEQAAMTDTLDEKRAIVADKIRTAEVEIDHLPEGPERDQLAAEAAETRRQASQFIPGLKASREAEDRSRADRPDQEVEPVAEEERHLRDGADQRADRSRGREGRDLAPDGGFQSGPQDGRNDVSSDTDQDPRALRRDRGRNRDDDYGL